MHDILTASKNEKGKFNWIVPDGAQDGRKGADDIRAQQIRYQRRAYKQEVTAEQVDEWQQYMVKR